jgi:hypothetical protein
MFQLWEKDFLLLIVKIFFMAISMIYAVFSFMVLRQVSLMNKSFTASLHGFFTFLAWLHFFVSLVAIILVFTLL